ncbi:MAG: hypothetical protein ABI333_11080 [bacterium]
MVARTLFVFSLCGLLGTGASSPLAQGKPPARRVAPRVSPGTDVPERVRSLTQRTYHARIVKGRAYVATTVGLRIVDVRRPTRPTALGTLIVPDSLNGLAVDATTAYAAAGPHGVVIADVTNPRRPKKLARIDTPGSANQVVLDGTHLYVADGSFGVAVYDVANPRRPRKLAAVKTGCYTRDVALHGRWIYVACGRKGLLVFLTLRSSPRNPAWPKPLHRMKLAGDVRNVAFGPGRTLYVAAGEAGLHILDARRPERLRLVATTKVPDFAHGVSAWGPLTAVAAGEGGVLLFNCRRRNKPRLLARYQSKPNRSANKVLLRRQRLYVAYDAAGLHILQVAGRRLLQRSVFPPPPKKSK